MVTAKVKDSAARTLNGQGVATVIRHDGSIIPHGEEKSSLTHGKIQKKSNRVSACPVWVYAPRGPVKEKVKKWLLG